MRVGIFSDVHGNLEALETVIEAYKAENIDKYIFLGDAVGYGANPNECCQLIKNLADYAILGNHDAACCNKLSFHWFNPSAKTAIIWSQKQLSQENKQWLETLDYTLEFQGFLMSHGLPLNPNAFEYDDDILKIRLFFNRFGGSYPICFLGHSHRPIAIFKRNDEKGSISIGGSKKVSIRPDRNYLINVGSVGQPRDGNPKSCYTILDTNKMTLTFCRAEYNIEKAAEKILKARLPQMLAKRLIFGF